VQTTLGLLTFIHSRFSVGDKFRPIRLRSILVPYCLLEPPSRIIPPYLHHVLSVSTLRALQIIIQSSITTRNQFSSSLLHILDLHCHAVFQASPEDGLRLSSCTTPRCTTNVSQRCHGSASRSTPNTGRKNTCRRYDIKPSPTSSSLQVL